MPRHDSGAREAHELDEELAIEVTFETDDEQSGVNTIPAPPLAEQSGVQAMPSPPDMEQSGVKALPSPPVGETSGVNPLPSSPRGAAEPSSFVPGAPVVLLVDDEPLIRRHFAAALASRYTVYEAGDGAEGLATLARMPRPDCIVCDVNMPRLGGIQFARAVKMLAPMRGVPVAFLSSSRDPRAVCDAINAGAKHFLSKKDTPDHILTKLEKILSAR